MAVDDAERADRAAHRAVAHPKVTAHDDDSALNRYFECEREDSTVDRRTRC